MIKSLAPPSAVAGRDGMTRLIIAAVAVVAAGLTLYQLSRPGLLFGVTEYDDGVYFGSSVRLVNGAVPYRDFVLVHPPGFELLASPVALLSRLIGTRDALAVLRLFMPLVAAANVVLVGMLVSHRGRLATLAAAGLMAVFPAEVNATHTVLLEPLLDVFCLLGAVLVFDGDTFARGLRLLAGGAAFGFAGTIKAWALIPVLVVAVLCLPAIRTRLVPFLGGVVAGFAVPTLPFFIAAPGAFYRDVVATQLSRIGGSGRIGLSSRLVDLTGTTSVAGGAVAIAAVVVLIGLVVAAFVLSRRRPATLEWFAISSTVAVAALLLAPAEFYGHYAAFFAPFAAVVVGVSLGRLVGRRPPRAVMAMAAIALTALAANQIHVVAAESARDVSLAVDAVIPAGGCALSDSASNLITADRFVSSRPGCPVMADAYGTTIVNGGRTAAAVDVWQRAFAQADYVVLYSMRNGRIPLVASLRTDLADQFRLVQSGGLLIFVRNGLQVAVQPVP
jgi:alpha-1,2-mannosyltransferase